MRRAQPGMTREHFEASYCVDASDRLVCAQCADGEGAERRLAVSRLQLAKCSRAAFELTHRLLDRSATRGPFRRFDWLASMRVAWQSAHVIRNHDRVAQRLRTQLGGARVFRAPRHELDALARGFRKTG